MNRALTGIQPSGELHIGNYFGALAPIVEMSKQQDAIVLIVDLHALNGAPQPEELFARIHEVAVTLLACGLDMSRATLVQQSRVAAHSELSLLLGTMTPMGVLERMHAYKDKVANNKPATAGLFTYPVLQAADILLYHPEVVPVGKDQAQHLEMAIDLAERFNNRYGNVFTIPRAEIAEAVAVVPGLDGQKMSKSYGNTIPLFAEEEELRRLVMSIKTASVAMGEPLNPEDDLVFAYHRLVSGPQLEELEQRYRSGSIGFGESKQILFENLNNFLKPMHEKRTELLAQPEMVRELLIAGSQKAQVIADETLAEVQKVMGLR